MTLSSIIQANARLLFLILLAAFVGGCVVVIAPYQSKNDLVISIHSTSIQPPPPVVAPVAAASVARVVTKDEVATTHCPVYTPPAHGPMPPTPQFTPAERADPDMLNKRFAGYIGDLRDYIFKTGEEDNRTYTQYQKDCTTVPSN